MTPALSLRTTLLASLILVLTACGSSSDGTTVSGEDLSTPLVFETGDFQNLTLEETDTLLFVREEEKLARDVYLSLYDKWQKKTFQNIATKSEQKHMDAIKVLLDGYGLNDPVINDDTGNFNNPEILSLYQQLLARGESSLEEGLQ
ncbi:unnamed protein product, partial [Cyprideis torosa]